MGWYQDKLNAADAARERARPKPKALPRAVQIVLEQHETEQRIKELKASGDRAGVEGLERYLALLEGMLIGETMGTTYNKAIEILADRLVAAKMALISLDDRQGSFPSGWYAKERERLIVAIRAADAASRQAIDEYRAEALEQARKLRARSKIDRDPGQRAADALEMNALLAGGVSAQDLVDEAAEALEADRPLRARFLLDVAAAKGGAQYGVSMLASEVEMALDAADPVRAKAAELEAQVEGECSRFEIQRLRHLTESGVGVDENGFAASGRPGEAARSNIARKVREVMSGSYQNEPRDLVTGGAGGQLPDDGKPIQPDKATAAARAAEQAAEGAQS